MGCSPILQLNGFDQTVGGLNANDSAHAAVIQSTGTGAPAGNSSCTLTVNNDTNNSTFWGYFRDTASGTGTIALTKGGTSNLTLIGPNITYTGATTVTNGKLNLQDTTAFASTITLTDLGTLQLTANGDDLAFTRTISGSGMLVVGSAMGKKVVLTGSVNVAGGTTVGGGAALNVNGSLGGNLLLAGGSSLGGGGFIGRLTAGGAAVNEIIAGAKLITLSSVTAPDTINAGATLKVTGTLGGDNGMDVYGLLEGIGAVNKLVTIQTGAHIAPGASIGTLTLPSGLVLGSPGGGGGGAVLDFELDSPGVADQIVITGGAFTVNGTAGIPGTYNTFHFSGAGLRELHAPRCARPDQRRRHGPPECQPCRRIQLHARARR